MQSTGPIAAIALGGAAVFREWRSSRTLSPNQGLCTYTTPPLATPPRDARLRLPMNFVCVLTLPCERWHMCKDAGLGSLKPPHACCCYCKET
jgi:hypothetical protein